MSDIPKTVGNYSNLTVDELNREVSNRQAMIRNNLDQLHNPAELKSEFLELIQIETHLRKRLEPGNRSSS